MTEFRPLRDPAILALASTPAEDDLNTLLTGTFFSEQYQYDALGTHGELTSVLLELDAARCFVISVHAGPGRIGHLTAPLRGVYRLDGTLLRLMPEHSGSHMLYNITQAGPWGFQVQWCYAAEVQVQWQRVQPRRLAHI